MHREMPFRCGNSVLPLQGNSKKGLGSDQACIHVPRDKMYKIHLMSLLDTSKVPLFLYILKTHDGVWNQGSGNDINEEVHR